MLYGILIWGNVNFTLLEPLHILQKKIVRLITFNDNFPIIPGPLVHTLPLFYNLNMLKIYDIYKLQVGNFVYESINNIGHSQSVINYTTASDVHDHNTRFANLGYLFVNYVRTNRYGLKALKYEGVKLWATIPTNVKQCRSKTSFKINYKKDLINMYLC